MRPPKRSVRESRAAQYNRHTWPTTPQEWCAWFHRLDNKHRTSTDSPLHHNNRCPIHKVAR